MKRAGEVLSELVEKRFKITEVSMTQHEAEELPNLLGDASTPVCASFFQVRGELPGFLLLVMPVHEVAALLEPLVGQGEGEMADSAIGEIGNIVGSAFLNHIADHYHIYAAPTPPQVFRDMIGALMGSLAAVLVSGGKLEVPVVRTQLTQNEGVLSAFLLWIPESFSLDELRQSK